MSGPWHPTGRASVSQTRPRALGVCQRCGFTYNHDRLRWQLQWVGTQLNNLQILVCDPCYDRPQPQLRVFVIPPDPVPILNPRPENYEATVPSYIATEIRNEFGEDSFAGDVLTTELGEPIIWEIRDTPTPDPNNPVLYPDG